jgi:hypothetical protein
MFSKKQYVLMVIWLLLTPFIWDLTEEEKMSSYFMQDTGTAYTENYSVTALG